MHMLRINAIAQKDLFDIKEYITQEFDNPTSATKVVSKIIESYETLRKFPMLGGELSNKIDVSTNYRYLVSGNCIVFYKVDSEYVSIYRILDARRDYIKILFNDEEFETEIEQE